MDSGNAISYIFKSFLFLLIFGSILFLAYITTKLVASKVNNTMKGKYISVVETINLGTDKKLYLVKVSNTFILLSSSGKKLEFLTVVPIEDYEEATENQWSLKAANTDNFSYFANLTGIANLVNKNFKINNIAFKSSIDFKSNLNRVKKVISSIIRLKDNGSNEDKDREGKTNEK